MYISVLKLAVVDVDRAVDFYVNKLGWEKTMDVDMGDGNRWVTIAPSGEKTSFTLTKEGESALPAASSPGVILECDDVFSTQAKLSKAGVEFTDDARNEPWGGWAMFKDSEGNVIGLHSPVPAGVSAN
jgi:lactoylglutathione lyase